MEKNCGMISRYFYCIVEDWSFKCVRASNNNIWI